MPFPRLMYIYSKKDARFLLLYAIAANLYGLLLVLTDKWFNIPFFEIDNLLIFLCAPIIYSVINHSRSTYVLSSIIGQFVSCWVLIHIDTLFYEKSIQTLLVINGAIICLGEFVQRKISAYSLDITKRKLMEKELQRHLQHEKGLALCSRELLHNDDNAINCAIKYLLESAEADRVYIFENFTDPKDGLCMRQTNESVAQGILPQIGKPELQHIPYNQGNQRWKETLEKGDNIQGLIKNFPEDERAELESQGILALLALPIGVNGLWHGFIGFDNTKTQIEFDESCVQLLRIGAELIGNYIERKEAERALLSEHHHLLSIFDSMDEAIYVADPKTYKILYSNEALNKCFGNRIGENCYEAIQNQKSPCSFCTNHIIFDEHPGETYTWELKNKITQCWYRCIDRTIHWTNGQLVRFEMAIDITNTKTAEEERLKHERQMQQAKKIESIGILAGGIAHDFNNLLMAIVGNISLAKKLTNQPNRILECLENAENATNRAQSLTQQLLTFSKGGSPVKETANIINIVQDTVTFSLIGSNISCEFSFPKEIRLVDVDKGQFSQVIQNLVINAKQAMPEGGTIKIIGSNITLPDHENKHDISLQAGDYVQISINDQGIGIPQEHLQKIFDPYFTTKQEGSGLGLATTYSIIKNHEGAITIESKIGSGTTFNIFLPISKNEIQTPKQDVQDELLAGQGRILIMDDEEMIRDVTSKILEEIGYQVDAAEDGAETIEKYKKSIGTDDAFDAVIMDLTIPGGMGGKETIVKLHEIDPQVKAIVSSGYSGDPIMANYQDFGFSGVICKPYKFEEIGKVLHRVLST